MKENKCIHCSVQQCAHHCPAGYCTLNHICIGTHEPNPSMPACTDCKSFQEKS